MLSTHIQTLCSNDSIKQFNSENVIKKYLQASEVQVFDIDIESMSKGRQKPVAIQGAWKTRKRNKILNPIQREYCHLSALWYWFLYNQDRQWMTEWRNLIPRVCCHTTPCRHENEAEIPVKYSEIKYRSIFNYLIAIIGIGIIYTFYYLIAEALIGSSLLYSCFDYLKQLFLNH